MYDQNKSSIPRFVGTPKPLKNKIITEEVTKKTQSVNNNTAAENDKIPIELLKYGPETLFEEKYNNLNTVSWVLLPTLKLEKARRPIKKLKPLNLLNSLRRTLSINKINRVKPKINENISEIRAVYQGKPKQCCI